MAVFFSIQMIVSLSEHKKLLYKYYWPQAFEQHCAHENTF